MKVLRTVLFLAGVGFPFTAHALDEPLAVIDGVAISSEEVEKGLAGQLSKLEEQIYNLKRQKLDALINEKLLEKEAAKRKLTVPALLDAEVTSKVGLVTEQEIENFYQENKAQVKGEQAEVREKIRTYLQNQKLTAKREEFLRSLRGQAKVVVNLKAPPVQRLEISAQGAPFKGGEKAPVTIVEFTDFHCPFCKRALATLAEIESKYSDKVKIVFRDFPIDQLHPRARSGHEAARCADEQGKFWAYHDKLFDNAPKTSLEDLKGYAKQVEMDVPAFEKCVASGKYKAAVQNDIDEGARLGVTGTPAFFINGRLVSGAQPFESFARVIDDELARGPAR
ncbi:MAG TPA: thioredoxin domain-containing protein [Candidatus Binatia bacterium]|jgi:protein-disulfide isomerase